MKSLYGSMKSGGASYGMVPGNGAPKADDKIMNVGPGHVVPAENAHIAKKVVGALGYDPNVKVDMNQGQKYADESIPIKISSKEYFLNDEQVNQMKSQLGLDPELLSPNSDYNKRVDSGTTKQVKDMVNEKLSMYDLMMNNNNQYAAYQNGGNTGMTEDAFKEDLSQKTFGTSYGETNGAVDVLAGNEWPKFQQGNSAYQFLGESVQPQQIDDLQTSENGITEFPEVVITGQRPEGSVTGLATRPVQPIPTTEIDRTILGRDGQPIVGTDPNPNPQAIGQESAEIKEMRDKIDGVTPDQEKLSAEDQHLKDLIDKSQKLEDQEVAANAAMGLWNMSRERQPLPEPVYMNPSLVRRDYESMKTDMRSDLSRAEKRNSYAMRELGVDATKMVGLATNTQENLRKGKRSIWDMQQADMAGNVGIENAAKDKYSTMKLQRDMAEGQSADQFSREKGEAMAGNVREIFGAKEAGLYRTSELQGIEVNRQMANLDSDYNRLDKQKMVNKNIDYISRDQWYKMSEQERQQLKDKLQS